MTTYHSRQTELVKRVSEEALKLPRLPSGLWFHNDIRNNYYYASYLIAAGIDLNEGDEELRSHMVTLGSEVLLRMLSLQNREAGHPLYGHWPLGLNPSPEEAAPNKLPAELLGCLIAYFNDRYGGDLPEKLRAELEVTLDTLYHSTYYRVPQVHYGHHESKYIATKLIFGYRYDDVELLAEGVNDLTLTLNRLREIGMPEYGALPWFWHWIQAFTCVYECVRTKEIRAVVGELLNELWMIRAKHYLGGAWVGARMRSLPHDLPRDRNVAFDYVQFGDFKLPADLPRVEYAGLLFYEASAEARRIALERNEPVELEQVVIPWTPGAGPLHTYTYITNKYAVGSIAERVKEFDNEQHRWDITFPLGEEDTINHLYLFQPGDRYKEGDPRHQSDGGRLSMYRNKIAVRYPSSESPLQRLIGVLPKGEWIQEERALFGFTHGVYVAVYLKRPYVLIEQSDRNDLVSEGLPNGVMVEVASAEEIAGQPINSLDDFRRWMQEHGPVWSDLESELL